MVSGSGARDPNVVWRCGRLASARAPENGTCPLPSVRLTSYASPRWLTRCVTRLIQYPLSPMSASADGWACCPVAGRWCSRLECVLDGVELGVSHERLGSLSAPLAGVPNVVPEPVRRVFGGFMRL